MNVQDAYDSWSSSYDSDTNRTRDLDSKVTQDSLKHFQGRHYQNQSYQGKTILELGCGTGKNTIFFSQIASQVIAVDFSPGMLDKAREKIEAENDNKSNNNKTSNIEFIAADITKPWYFLNSPVDLISCNLILEHIEDISDIFNKAYNSLANKGQLFVCELHPFKQYQGSVARFSRDTENTNKTIEIPVFIHHSSDFFNSAIQAGFSIVMFNEWWHENDINNPPRLISFLFQK